MNLINLESLKCHPAEPPVSETSDREVIIVIENTESFIQHLRLSHSFPLNCSKLTAEYCMQRKYIFSKEKEKLT